MIITTAKRRNFLNELGSNGGNVSKAVGKAACSRRGIYDLRKKDKKFAAKWLEALDMGIDSLEDEATRRGKDGVVEEIRYKGDVVGRITRYSDNLLMFMMKGRRPNVYKDRVSAELTGKDGGPIKYEDVQAQRCALMERIADLTVKRKKVDEENSD